MNNIKIDIGKLIRQAREGKGLTMKETGARMGVSESTYSRYESGRNLTVDTLDRIARAIGEKINVSFG